jgi:hypothetical protein
MKKHFFFYTIILLTILSISSSVMRFTVNQDFTVAYEGDCDPYTQSCYVYCETCSDPFYYSIIERQAAEIYSLCGGDVTACDAAYECQEDVSFCEITYCDPKIEGDECEFLTDVDRTEVITIDKL